MSGPNLAPGPARAHATGGGGKKGGGFRPKWVIFSGTHHQRPKSITTSSYPPFQPPTQRLITASRHTIGEESAFMPTPESPASATPLLRRPLSSSRRHAASTATAAALLRRSIHCLLLALFLAFFAGVRACRYCDRLLLFTLRESATLPPRLLIVHGSTSPFFNIPFSTATARQALYRQKCHAQLRLFFYELYDAAKNARRPRCVGSSRVIAVRRSPRGYLILLPFFFFMRDAQRVSRLLRCDP